MSEVVAHMRAMPLSAIAQRSPSRLPASPPPLVAVLCAAPRARVAAAGVALALMRALGVRYALAAAAGEGSQSSFAATPAAFRAAAALRERGSHATAGGRLVWLADVPGPLPPADVAGRAAALSAELGRSAAAVGAPAAVAVPFARTSALDRVLAWHDAILVVREPDAADGLVECALASLAELGRPVAELAPPRRSSGGLAAAGLVAPEQAGAAVARLGLGAR